MKEGIPGKPDDCLKICYFCRKGDCYLFSEVVKAAERWRSEAGKIIRGDDVKD